MVSTVIEHIVDALFVVFIFSPLVVCYWNSTWNLIGLYLLPSNKIASGWISVAISIVLMVASFFTQDVLNKYVKKEKYVSFYLVSRLFTYVMSFSQVSNWRGIWELLNLYIGITIPGSLTILGIGTVGLIALRSYRNVLTPPGAWVLDVDTDNHFTIIHLFGTKKGSVLYVIDVLFGVVVVSTLVVLVWRGQWMVLQLSISPNNDLWRGIIVFSVGNVLVVTLIVTQFPARKLAGHLHTTHPLLQIVFEDACVLLVCFSAVCYWHGLWALLDVMVIGYDPNLTQWLLHALGFGGLMLLRVCRSLQFMGYNFDGEYPEGIGLVQTPSYCNTILASLCRREALSQAIHKTATTETTFSLPDSE
ncbi:uncharacterized protein LOC124258240 isoform X2 [Haliotis rubra]|uniref:uncharacterized protein LOC124258240 isoform X2 n=1 Tax=Haliotis rubra TaxID=36100 RepID=UPI001EE51545|nr:uncharacterized protein LOC124258240 isoform X2 [Haliotis rubra]